jgi:AGCS family alanine or glycine:cation symporter
MNGLMALPNLVGLLALSGLVVRETREFFSRPEWREIAVTERPLAATK